jgi:iron(II)-dependent oxidoreductase
VVVPSHQETFGLVALEALAGGAPVVSYDIGNLPALTDAGGITVPHADGPTGLWRAVHTLLGDPVRCKATSWAGYYRARDYRPTHIADLLLKVVS